MVSMMFTKGSVIFCAVMTAMSFFCVDNICAQQTPVTTMIKGVLNYSNGSPAANQRIYFISTYGTEKSTVSAQTIILDGRIANPSDTSKDDGTFVISVDQETLYKMDSERFSLGMIGGFGPGFNILRTTEGIHVPIAIDRSKIANIDSPVIINVGKVIIR